MLTRLNPGILRYCSFYMWKFCLELSLCPPLFKKYGIHYIVALTVFLSANSNFCVLDRFWLIGFSSHHWLYFCGFMHGNFWLDSGHWESYCWLLIFLYSHKCGTLFWDAVKLLGSSLIFLGFALKACQARLEQHFLWGQSFHTKAAVLLIDEVSFLSWGNRPYSWPFIIVGYFCSI